MTNKEAIVVLKKHISPYDNCKADNEANQAIKLAIKALEERPQGEWIHNGINVEGMDIYRCSICSRLIVTWSARIDEYPYCHCGAKMKGRAE